MVAGIPLTNEELERTIAVYQENGFSRAARLLEISEDALKYRLKRAAERGLLGTKPVLPGFQIKQSTSKTADGTYIKQIPESGEEFQLLPGHEVKGVSAYLDAEGRTRAKWVKTRSGITANLVGALKKEFEEYAGAAQSISIPDNTDESLLTVYPIADQHNGLLAWGAETGEDYDLKIGEERLRGAMNALVTVSPKSQQSIILNLGDWQHTDDSTNRTPENKNKLDADSRYFRILCTGVKLMMDCIELALAKHQNVLVRNIPGNHDPHASIALTVALSAFYSNNERVTVDTDPSDFFFYRFGNSLIGATHGHKLKPESMAMLLANARPGDWAAAQFRYFYFGHIHHITAKEIGGVICESFQSLAAKDAYSYGKGYIAGQSLSSITHHIEDGEISRHRINIQRKKR
jgi:hypothetical protein